MSLAVWQIFSIRPSKIVFSISSSFVRFELLLIFSKRAKRAKPVGLKTEKGIELSDFAFCIEAIVSFIARLKSSSISFPSAEKSRIVPMCDSQSLSIVA